MAAARVRTTRRAPKRRMTRGCLPLFPLACTKPSARDLEGPIVPEAKSEMPPRLARYRLAAAASGHRAPAVTGSPRV